MHRKPCLALNAFAMRHMIAKAKQNKRQQQALAKSSNILQRMSKRKTNKRKEMPSIFLLTLKIY